MAEQRLQALVLALLVLALAVVALPLVAAHNGVIHDDSETAEEHEAATPSSESSSEPTDLRSNGHLVANKIGAMVVIFFVPFLAAFLPYFITFASRLIVYGMLFAGGLFFTLALLHLVADSAAGLEYLTKSSYPWAYLLVIAGYMAAFLADIVVHMIMDKRKDNQEPSEGAEALVGKQQPVLSGAIVSQQSVHTPSAPPPEDVESGNRSPGKCTRCPSNCGCPADNCPCPTEAPVGPSLDKVVGTGTDLEKPYLLTGNALHLSVTDAILLVFALCFHAVFEGLAIGVSATASDMWSTAGTILLHKFFEGMALGVTILAVTRRFVLGKLAFYAFCFGITAPVGIAIGIIIDRTSTGRDGLWASSVLDGIAAGVFIFVALNHIVMKAFKRVCSDSQFEPLAKYAALFLGCTTMALIQMKHD